MNHHNKNNKNSKVAWLYTISYADKDIESVTDHVNKTVDSILHHFTHINENEKIDYSKYSYILIEDNEINQLIMQYALEAKWVNNDVVKTFDDGKNFIECMDQNKDTMECDLSKSIIFVDYHMKYMNGKQTVELIRKYCEEHNLWNPLIILQSSDHLREEVQKIHWADYVWNKMNISNIDSAIKNAARNKKDS